MATNAMRYSDQILDNVRTVLFRIKERSGRATTAFLDAQYKEMQGQYADIVINVALLSIGKKERYQSDLSQAQMESLVARSKQVNGDLVREIAALRAAWEPK